MLSTIELAICSTTMLENIITKHIITVNIIVYILIPFKFFNLKILKFTSKNVTARYIKDGIYNMFTNTTKSINTTLPKRGPNTLKSNIVYTDIAAPLSIITKYIPNLPNKVTENIARITINKTSAFIPFSITLVFTYVSVLDISKTAFTPDNANSLTESVEKT